MTPDMPAMDELKSCPFCNSEHVTDRYVRDGRQMFCIGCGASVAPSYHGPNNDTLKRAREAWNRRASLNAVPEVEVVKALKSARAAYEAAIPDGAWYRDGGETDIPIRAAITAYLSVQAGWRSMAGDDVLAERRRQIEAEGWTPEHDDAHDKGELAAAASCYAFSAVKSPYHLNNQIWPWSSEWWKPADSRRNLVKAGALIIAEIERLDRLATPQPAPDAEVNP